VLKVTVERGDRVTTLKLEGKLSGLWVDEAAKVWRDVSGGIAAKDVIVGLSGVTFIDEEGKKLLGQMLGRGAQLRDGRLMTRYIINQLVQEAKDLQKKGA
jgi:anti-anti-sigma regulatory factor